MKEEQGQTKLRNKRIYPVNSEQALKNIFFKYKPVLPE
jgi:hypothetical protein